MNRTCRWLFIFVAAGGGAFGQATQALQERWNEYVARTYDWKRISMVAVETAFDQTFELDKCGRPPYCFPDRFGGAMVQRTARTSIEFAAGALFHEDIRRRPSGLTGFRRRAFFAIAHAPLARGQDGAWRPAYSRFAGTFGGVAVSAGWRGKPVTGADLFGAFGSSAAYYFQDALITEFEPDVRRWARRHFSLARH